MHLIWIFCVGCSLSQREIEWPQITVTALNDLLCGMCHLPLTLAVSDDSFPSVHEAQWAMVELTDMVRQSLGEAWHISIVGAHRGVAQAE